MAQVNVIGRITADLELKTSEKSNPYVRFDIAENIGSRQTLHQAMNTADIPAVVHTAGRDFGITDTEQNGVLQRLIESDDLSLYGLANAVTRHSQDVESYDRATDLEGIGFNILSMPPRQWTRINQVAA